MARSDMAGLFWDDTPPPKPPKAEKIKRQPPERTWERDDYLPYLDEALSFDFNVMSDMELYEACLRKERLVLDVECYWNYFICGFKSVETGRVWYVEFMGKSTDLDRQRLRWALDNFQTLGFNSLLYDLPILALACAGRDTEQLKHATNDLIVNEVQPYFLLKSQKVKRIKCDHIDIIEVAPLQASLKLYSGRIGCERMQDLPFDSERYLTDVQIAITRLYNINDLTNTVGMVNALDEQLKLREKLSEEYGIDLRSKSDAQIAEAVIAAEIELLNGGVRPTRPEIAIGTRYQYQTPHFLKFYSPTMQWTLDLVQRAWFIVDETGGVAMPPELADLEIPIGTGVYRMGIGGLHSSEKSAAHIADETCEIEDTDVTSYYPYIILNQGLYPRHLGTNFLRVYRTIVERRVAAKLNANKLKEAIKNCTVDSVKKHMEEELKTISTEQDSLKITINGSFGKLGSKYSVLYSPDLLIQVTLTGQLALLMLVERFEMAGITVISANTDGIVTKCPKHLLDLRKQIVKQWEAETSFETESTKYKGLYSRDVNNYIAIKTDGDVKTKGVFVIPAKGKFNLQKNPQNQICAQAVVEYLSKETPIDKTIKECNDILRFLTVRNVKGGAVKVYDDGQAENEYLGKSVRWYYGQDTNGEIVYAKSGNKVPRSEGAFPCMQLPKQFPDNIDYNWYIVEANAMLEQVGVITLQ